MGNKKGRMSGHTERSREVDVTATILKNRGYHVTKVTDKYVSVIAPVSGAVVRLRSQLELQLMEKRGLISLKKVKYDVKTQGQQQSAA